MTDHFIISPTMFCLPPQAVVSSPSSPVISRSVSFKSWSWRGRLTIRRPRSRPGWTPAMLPRRLYPGWTLMNRCMPPCTGGLRPTFTAVLQTVPKTRWTMTHRWSMTPPMKMMSWPHFKETRIGVSKSFLWNVTLMRWEIQMCLLKSCNVKHDSGFCDGCLHRSDRTNGELFMWRTYGAIGSHLITMAYEISDANL